MRSGSKDCFPSISKNINQHLSYTNLVSVSLRLRPLQLKLHSHPRPILPSTKSWAPRFTHLNLIKCHAIWHATMTGYIVQNDIVSRRQDLNQTIKRKRDFEQKLVAQRCQPHHHTWVSISTIRTFLFCVSLDDICPRKNPHSNECKQMAKMVQEWMHI